MTRFGVDKVVRWGSEDEARHIAAINARPWWQCLIDWLLRAEYIHGGTFRVHFKRWCIGGWFNGRRVYLHRFTGSDYARHLHDHPKTFISIGLRGGYVEQVPDFNNHPPWKHSAVIKSGPFDYRRWVAPWFRIFPSTHIHRIRIATGAVCWTLCITAKSDRNWGFWSTEGEKPEARWIQWERYIFGGER